LLVFSNKNYKNTDYYNTTQKSYSSVFFNKGNYGEYLTYEALRSFEAEGARFLFNCYLPKENGETTEIDILMIHSSGIYVLESKNYSGWIFGSETQKYWTQTLPSRRKNKSYFLNPIIQNKLHIKWLTNLVGGGVPVHSIIVFSERCELKQIELSSTNIHVVKRSMLGPTVRAIDSRTVNLLSMAQVNDLYAKLYPYTQVSESVKSQHIHNVQHNQSTQGNGTYNALRCPMCGSSLVLRQAKKGSYAGKQFYGCSNFPRCRYIRNI
jgi:hypothetical protein